MGRDRRGRDERRTASEQDCERLFAAILVDDRVDAHTELPDAIPIDLSREQIVACFALCRQLWIDGVDRRRVAAMIAPMRRGGGTSADEQRAFKHLRAKFKHLRFAFASFDERHRYPPALDRLTKTMGQLQDAFKNGRRARVVWRATMLRLLLSRPLFGRVTRAVDSYRAGSPESLRRFMCGQMLLVRESLARPEVTGREFHQLRKIISRQVAMYDALRTLYPEPAFRQLSRYLGAINGLMGAEHDRLIERRFAGLDYHGESFALPPEIRQRLSAVVEKYQRFS